MKKSARLIFLLIAMPFVVHADSLVTGKDEQGVRIRILAERTNWQLPASKRNLTERRAWTPFLC